MRLQPTAHKKSRELFDTTTDLFENWQEEKAKRFRCAKIQLYEFVGDCRVRNGELIEGTTLKAKERRLLRLRYVRSMPWQNLFRTMGYTESHCKRIHRDAITKVARQNPDVDFKTLYETERRRLDELLAQVGETM